MNKEIELLDELYKGGSDGYTYKDFKGQIIGSYIAVVYDDYIELSNHSVLKLLEFSVNNDYGSEYYEYKDHCFYNIRESIGKRITRIDEPYKVYESDDGYGENEIHALINFYSRNSLVLTIELRVEGVFGSLDMDLFLELDNKRVKVLSTDD